MNTIKFSCPTCEQTLDASEEMFGQTVECPACDTPIFLEETPPPVPADPSASKGRKTKVTVQRKKLEESRGRLSQKHSPTVKPPFYQEAARASWKLPLIALLFAGIATPAVEESQPFAGMVIGLIFLFVLLVGFVIGIIGWMGSYRHHNPKTFAPAISGTLLSGAIFGLMLYIGAAGFQAARAQARFPQSLYKMVEETNAQLPQLTDDGSERFDRIVVKSPERIEFYFTLLDATQGDIFPGLIEAQVKPKVLQLYQEGDVYRLLRDNKVKLDVIYRDRLGNQLATVSVP